MIGYNQDQIMVTARSGKVVGYTYDKAGPKYQRVYGKKLYILTESFTFIRNETGESFTIAAGFTWDGASIPRILWGYTTPFDPMTIIAALIHDWLYKYGIVSRAQADEMFREFLLCELNGPVKTGRMFWAVRIFGIRGYDSKRKKALKAAKKAARRDRFSRFIKPKSDDKS